MSQLSTRSFFTRGMDLSSRTARTCMGFTTQHAYPAAVRNEKQAIQ